MHMHKTKFETKKVSIMWSVMGEQNLQAKTVYCLVALSILSYDGQFAGRKVSKLLAMQTPVEQG